MTIFFTSDTHFAHKRVITFDSPVRKRYSTIDEHDADMVARWNSVVGVNDDVYHLGDFSFCTTANGLREYFKQLNGIITLVKGNHDHRCVYDVPSMPGTGLIRIVHYEELRIGSHSVVLSHYPFEEWNKSRYGSVHLHGHLHGKVNHVVPKRLDVGVDCWDGYPVSWDEIESKIDK